MPAPRKKPPAPRPPGTHVTTGNGYGITYHGNKPPAPGYTSGVGNFDTQEAKLQQYRGQGLKDANGDGYGQSPTSTFGWIAGRGLQSGALLSAASNPGGPPPGWLPDRQPGPGGGGGGGGAAAAKAQQQANLNTMLQLLSHNPMAAKIDPAYNADIKIAQDAYAKMGAGVSMADPYAQLGRVQAPTVNPGMEQFLQSQGVGTGDYGNAVQYANAQLAAGGQNWQQLAGALGANHVAAQQGAKDVMGLQGQATVDAMRGDQQAAHNAIQSQQFNAVLSLLSNAMSSGVQIPNLNAILAGFK